MKNNPITTSTSFPISSPKKQAKSYEIDLGQNEGAYKEELLIRYGDNTLNQLMNNKKTRGNNMNMEDIMKMNEQLKPFQERRIEEGAVSYSTKCEGIEDQMGKMDDNSKMLTDFENDLSKAIEAMTNDIFKFFDDTYNEFNPQLLEKYKYLKERIKEQKDENANLLKQIDLLLQENTQIMDMVYKIGSRLEGLEKKVGIEKIQVEEEEEEQSNINQSSNNMEKSGEEMEMQQPSENSSEVQDVEEA